LRKSFSVHAPQKTIGGRFPHRGWAAPSDRKRLTGVKSIEQCGRAMKLQPFAVRNSLFILVLALAAASAAGQTNPENPAAGQARAIPARITQAIDEAQMVERKGNVHPLARTEFDRGAASNATPMRRMMLLLERSPEQEAALQELMAEQMSKESPNFHKWLTPEEFGRQFGPADTDIEAVRSWLASHGFSEIKVNRGKTLIEFSGNVGQVRNAFRTDIHKFVVNGEERQANVGDPQIPAALTPVVAGIVSLHNFPMKSMRHTAGAFTRTPEGRVISELTGSTNQFFALGPADFARIYNIPSTLDGTNANIAIIGLSSIDVNDTHAFRALFGLPVNDPVVVLNGPDPGITVAVEGEADLDVQWSGAVAPKATIHYVLSEGTLTSDPLFLGAEYVIDNNSDDVMSLSFGQCETSLGNTANGFINTLWEQAAAQGITVTVSAGDPGSAGCDDFGTAKIAALGLAVNGIASTPFNIAVGGTDFDDAGNQTAFWNQNPPPPAPPTANDPVTRLSAKGYIPETTWNDSCAATATSSLLTTCAGTLANGIVGASGGPSAVYAKPSWQNGPTPADAHRDIPDISLFASDGPKSQSFYVVCQADAVSNPSTSCASSGSFSFLGAGGTSASAPAFAGIIALIGQSEFTQGRSRRQGNANFVLYKLGQTASNSCNSSNRTDPTVPAPAGCVFNDVTKGNNSVPCAGGSPNCSSTVAGTNGVLVTVNGATKTPAFTTGAGYDLATGLGTVNVTNLAAAWGTAVGGFKGTTTTLLINNSATPAAITHGTAVTAKVTVAVVAPATGTPTGDVSVVAPLGTVNGGNNGGPLPGGSGTMSFTGVILPGGTYNAKAHYSGDGTFGASDSAGVPVVVNKESSALQIAVVTFDANTGNITNGNATTFPYGSPYILRMDVLNSKGTACQPIVNGGIITGCALDATGTITLKDNGNALDGGSFPVNSHGHAEDQPIQLAAGTHPLTAVYSGDNSYLASVQVSDNLTVTKATTTTGVASLPSSITSGTMVTLTATISTQSNGAAPGGTVQFLNGATLIAGTVTLTPTNGADSSTGFASLKATLTTTISGLMPPRPMERTRPSPPVWWFVPLAMIMAAFVYFLGRFPKQRRYVYASMILFGAILAGVAGCGGGGGGPKTKTVTIQANYSGDGNYNSSSGQVSITVQ